MRLLVLIMGIIFSSSGFSDDFYNVKKLSKSYLKDSRGIVENEILEIHLPSILSPDNNTRNIQSVANVTVKVSLKMSFSVFRLQYHKKKNIWHFYRELEENQIFNANPILHDEYIDPMWNESHKLEARVSETLQEQLRKKGIIKQVKNTQSRCFISIVHGRALCDARYSTWDEYDPECITKATAFKRIDEAWVEILGKYAPWGGMRVDPQTGRIFEMIPIKSCTKN